MPNKFNSKIELKRRRPQGQLVYDIELIFSEKPHSDLTQPRVEF